jgi:type I restriction enzyme, R subunit
MKFTEAQLGAAIIQLLGEVGYPHVIGAAIVRQPDEVLIKEDLRAYLSARYAADNIKRCDVRSRISKKKRPCSATVRNLYCVATKEEAGKRIAK